MPDPDWFVYGSMDVDWFFDGHVRPIRIPTSPEVRLDRRRLDLDTRVWCRCDDAPRPWPRCVLVATEEDGYCDICRVLCIGERFQYTTTDGTYMRPVEMVEGEMKRRYRGPVTLRVGRSWP